MTADFRVFARPECDCNSVRVQDARRAREAAARAYLLALQASIAAGELMDEMVHDHNAWDRAAMQVMEVCGTQGTSAPMVLGILP